MARLQIFSGKGMQFFILSRFNYVSDRLKYMFLLSLEVVYSIVMRVKLITNNSWRYVICHLCIDNLVVRHSWRGIRQIVHDNGRIVNWKQTNSSNLVSEVEIMTVFNFQFTEKMATVLIHQRISHDRRLLIAPTQFK